MRVATSPRRGRLAFAAAATAAVLAATLGAGSAAAAVTWTVTPGGRVTGKAGTTTLKDTTDGNSLTCTSSELSGRRFKTGSGLPGAGLGSITSGTFTGCGPLPVTVTLRGLPWRINAASYHDGVARGAIGHIDITVSLAGCSFVIDGTAAGASDGVAPLIYTDTSHTLTLVPTGTNLHLYRVDGCAGLVHDGDRAAYLASYTVSPAQTITSP
jgi:hypothetical protein